MIEGHNLENRQPLRQRETKTGNHQRSAVLNGTRRLPAALLSLCYLAAAGAQVTVITPMPQTVTVHVSPTGKETVPPALFGSFLEPIGNSINHGITSEILTNPSLESGLWNHVNLENLFREQPELIESTNQTGIPLPWQSLNTAAGNRFELHVGTAANSWQSLELMGQPDQLTGIKQRVYLPIQRQLEYKTSIYAKHMSGPTKVTLSLRDHTSGEVLAEATVNAVAEGWTKYSAALHLPPGKVHRLEPVDFAVSVEGTERVDVDQISLMPADSLGIFDPDAVAMAKSMNLTELRLGGNFSSYYHWRDGVGPLDKRPTMENIAWGIPEYNTLGTDEFLQLCELLGTEPQFNLNMGSGTPAEAAEWVKYIEQRHHGPVIYELGNELYGKWQVGYPTVKEVAARTLEFSRAVRAVAPHARLLGTGQGPVAGQEWNAAQLGNPAGTFDDLTLHFIVGTNHPAQERLGPDFVAAAAYALPYAVGPYFDQAQAQVDSNPTQQGKVHFAVTEWLFNSKGYGERNFTNESPSWMNEGGAVLAAGFLNTLLRHTSEVTLADMTGMMEFAGVWKRREQVYAVPAFYAFQLYTVTKGDIILPVTSDTGAYAIKGGDAPLSEATGVPYVDVVATRSADGKTLTLLCVNRSLSDDVATTFDLGAMHITGPARVQQIAASSRYERNDEVEPHHVVPVESSLAAAPQGGLTAMLPHESVTVIRASLH